MTNNFHEGLFNLLQCHSVGALKPNTILLAMPDLSDKVAQEKFFKTVDIVASFNHNLIIFKPGHLKLNKKKKIDLWWRGETNGSLMALFAYLMTLSHDWSGSKIRLLRSVYEGESHEKAMRLMNDLKRQARIEAEIKIVPSVSRSYDVIKRLSSIDVDLTFLGMGATNGIEAKQSLERMCPLLEELPSTFLVWSNGEANIFV